MNKPIKTTTQHHQLDRIATVVILYLKYFSENLILLLGFQKHIPSDSLLQISNIDGARKYLHLLSHFKRREKMMASIIYHTHTATFNGKIVTTRICHIHEQTESSHGPITLILPLYCT